ncbi:hypothetical protein BDZ89DRAFT_1057515 [Hymenopellis radicata]|nr:hypothetical protein BDZ89DRAFT_1057515 [Hymenopellis radicata]
MYATRWTHGRTLSQKEEGSVYRVPVLIRKRGKSAGVRYGNDLKETCRCHVGGGRTTRKEDMQGVEYCKRYPRPILASYSNGHEEPQMRLLYNELKVKRCVYMQKLYHSAETDEGMMGEGNFDEWSACWIGRRHNRGVREETRSHTRRLAVWGTRAR